MMTKYTKTIGALAASTMLMGGYATAEIEGEINVGYTNMYEFRFVDYGQDLVSAGADIAFDLGDGWGINAGAWYGSTNDNKAGAVGSFNELDLYAGVSKEFGSVDIEVGYIFYSFQDLQAFDTQEVYASAATQFGGGFGANVTAYYDFEQWNGLYVNGEVTYTVEFSDTVTLDLAAGLAYADGHGRQMSRQSQVATGTRNGTVDGYQGFYLSAALPWAATDHLTITPFIKYTNADSDLMTDVKGLSSTGDDYFIAGAALSVAF